jgi:hypothetical protein
MPLSGRLLGWPIMVAFVLLLLGTPIGVKIAGCVTRPAPKPAAPR